MLTIQDYKNLIAENEAETLDVCRRLDVLRDNYNQRDNAMLAEQGRLGTRLLELNLHRQICKADLIKLQEAEIDTLKAEIAILKGQHLRRVA